MTFAGQPQRLRRPQATDHRRMINKVEAGVREWQSAPQVVGDDAGRSYDVDIDESRMRVPTATEVEQRRRGDDGCCRFGHVLVGKVGGSGILDAATSVPHLLKILFDGGCGSSPVEPRLVF